MNRQFPGRDLHPLVTCALVAHQHLVESTFEFKPVINYECDRYLQQTKSIKITHYSNEIRAHDPIKINAIFKAYMKHFQ